MSTLNDRVNGRLAQPLSRGSFFGVLGKLALGVGAIMAGGAGALALEGGTDVLAAPQCCPGQYACGTGSSCPGGTYPDYVNATNCCARGPAYYECVSCLSCTDKSYVCTIAIYDGSTCPQTPAHR